jgi:DNA (cytosine-5)-methyltransferase 1
MKHKFPYEWNLKDAVFTKDKGTVFSCFSCGGGSTMGYKLAGFDVIGCNEIDPKMMNAYITNHQPKFSFLESIETFKDRDDLPEELFDLDILDGSPPCSSFSMAGNREKDWGVEKKFREGQSEQVLDTLFFDFIDLAAKLQPKVVVAENVKGLLMGAARNYVRRIYDAFDRAGYYCQHFLLNASKMGVPQRRERVFFLCLRKDIAEPLLKQVDFFTQLPEIDMTFNEPDIHFGKIQDRQETKKKLLPSEKKLMPFVKPGDKGLGEVFERVYNKPGFFSHVFVFQDKVCSTITSGGGCPIIPEEERHLNAKEFKLAGSYPLDYNFAGNKTRYLVGMSVPPVMTAQIASRIYEQWLLPIKQNQKK